MFHASEHRGRRDLQGVWSFAITPMHDDGRIDDASIARNIEYIEKGGIRVIVPTGGTGEFFSLTSLEILTVAEVARGAVQQATIMPGIGGNLSTAIEQGQRLGELDISIAMVVPPSQPGSDRGLAEFYRRLAAEVPIDLVIFQAPHAKLSPEALIELGALKNVVGFKDEVGDILSFQRVLDNVGDKLFGVCGLSEGLAAPYHVIGAIAYTSGVSNVAPELAAAFGKALVNGDWPEATNLRRRFQPLTDLRARHGRHVPIVKAALKELGVIRSAAVRLPLMATSPDEVLELRGVLRVLGLPGVA